MGVKTWSYDPDKCDGDYCPANCYLCSKADDGEHLPIEAVLAMLSDKINMKGECNESKTD